MSMFWFFMGVVFAWIILRPSEVFIRIAINYLYLHGYSVWEQEEDYGSSINAPKMKEVRGGK